MSQRLRPGWVEVNRAALGRSHKGESAMVWQDNIASKALLCEYGFCLVPDCGLG